MVFVRTHNPLHNLAFLHTGGSYHLLLNDQFRVHSLLLLLVKFLLLLLHLLVLVCFLPQEVIVLDGDLSAVVVSLHVPLLLKLTLLFTFKLQQLRFTIGFILLINDVVDSELFICLRLFTNVIDFLCALISDLALFFHLLLLSNLELGLFLQCNLLLAGEIVHFLLEQSLLVGLGSQDLLFCEFALFFTHAFLFVSLHLQELNLLLVPHLKLLSLLL